MSVRVRLLHVAVCKRRPEESMTIIRFQIDRLHESKPEARREDRFLTPLATNLRDVLV